MIHEPGVVAEGFSVCALPFGSGRIGGIDETHSLEVLYSLWCEILINLRDDGSAIAFGKHRGHPVELVEFGADRIPAVMNSGFSRLGTTK